MGKPKKVLSGWGKDLLEVIAAMETGIFTPEEGQKAANEIIEDVPTGRYDVLEELNAITDWFMKRIGAIDDELEDEDE